MIKVRFLAEQLQIFIYLLHRTLRDLGNFCRQIKPDFWLVGEVVHGDYRRWANPETLDSVTDYECYKGLFSSLNDHNSFEIAYSVGRFRQAPA